MTSMSAEPGIAGVTTGRPFTVRDLEAMPDDGHRYELIDGVLIVTPAPGWAHQEGVGELFVQLRVACPRELRVVVAPFAVQPDEHNEVQPDVLVTRFDDLTPRNLPVAPLLAVEFLSPSTRAVRPQHEEGRVRADGRTVLLARRPRAAGSAHRVRAR